MTVSELISHLQKFPGHLKVWHSEANYVEGACPSVEPELILADDASLDGDEVDDEYFYYDPGDEDASEAYGLIILDPSKYGYHKTKDGYSKEIVLLKSTLDR